MSENKLILAKLARVMKDVEYIQKDAKNSHQNYRYASERIIKERLHDAFVEHGVIMQLNMGVPIAAGAVLYLPVEYVFWDVESGEGISGNFLGSGHTRDDKGVYAAMTGAIKYLLTGTFLIPTGDDPEDDKNEKPKGSPVVMRSGSVTDKQWNLITQLQSSQVIPPEMLTDLNMWAVGTTQTVEEASSWIETLKGCPKVPKPFDRAKVSAWIEKSEKKVYPVQTAIGAARVKYLRSDVLDCVPDDVLKTYAEHIKEKIDSMKVSA